MKKNGFTIMEIMVVVVILAAVAAMGVPSYFTTIENSRENEARTNLNIIHMGEKIFFLNNASVYWVPGTSTVAAANTALGVDMSATFYTTLSITANPTAATGYRARLTRTGGTRWVECTYTAGALATVCTTG